MNSIKGETQFGFTNMTQRVIELLDNGWIVEVWRGYDARGRFDGTYIINAETNMNLQEKRKS